MRYLVLGCGAIGGTVAAGLARDGHEVLACDADPAVTAAINERGLRITGPVENFTAAVTAVMPADLPQRLDGPVLLAVKAHHTAAAAATLAGRLHGDGFVVSLQNGLNAGLLTDSLGSGRVVEALVNFGADMIEPGMVLRGNRGTFVIGEIDGTVTDRVRALAADIADARVTSNVLGYLWAKQAYGAMLFATAVSDLPIFEVLQDTAFHPMLTELARQVLAQAPVTPMPFDGFDPADLAGSLGRLAEFNRGSAKTHSGVYRDLAVRHRPTEVEAILGPLDGPLVRRVAELVTAIEQGRRSCSRANLELLAGYERLERLGRPVNAVVSVIGAPDRAAGGPLAGMPVAVRTSSRWLLACRRPTAARCMIPLRPSPTPSLSGAAAARGRRSSPPPSAWVRRLRAPGMSATRAIHGIRRGRPAALGRIGGAGRRGRLRAGHRDRYRRVDPIPAAYCGVVG